MSSRHLVLGAGGPRAFLTGLGTVIAMRLFGLKDWTSIGGISGGSLPAILMADHTLSPRELVERIIAIEITDLLKPSDSGVDPLAQFAPGEAGHAARKEKFVSRLLKRGAWHTDKLGEMIGACVDTWPELFWTMAMTENSHILFTATGVYEYGFDGSFTVLSEEPAPVALAIRATIAIPGWLEGVVYKGRYLFDGSLSPFGGCPVAWVRRHFNGESSLVIRCLSSGKSFRTDSLLCRIGRKLLCNGVKAVPEMLNSPADINIDPKVPELATFRFKLSREEKELGILAGFNTAVAEMHRCAGLFQQGLTNLVPCADFQQFLALVEAQS